MVKEGHTMLRTSFIVRSLFFFIKFHDKYNIKKAYVSVIGNTHIPQIDKC